MKKLYILTAILGIAFVSKSQSFVEEFDSMATNIPYGFDTLQLSSPAGSASWFDGNTAVFAPYSMNGYIGVNYNSCTGTDTISNWLIARMVTLRNNDKIIFYTRTVDSATNFYPDRLQVRLSQNGASANVGTNSGSVGDFTTLLLDIDSTYCMCNTPNGYPAIWTKYMLTLSGLPAAGVNGRFAFHYYLENAGPTGANSNYIGIDSLAYISITQGVGQLSNTVDFSLSPNPARGQVKLYIHSTKMDVEKKLAIINMLGEKVSEIRFSGDSYRLNLNGLAQGVYSIIVSDSKSRGLKKLVVE